MRLWKKKKIYGTWKQSPSFLKIRDCGGKKSHAETMSAALVRHLTSVWSSLSVFHAWIKESTFFGAGDRPCVQRCSGSCFGFISLETLYVAELNFVLLFCQTGPQCHHLPCRVWRWKLEACLVFLFHVREKQAHHMCILLHIQDPWRLKGMWIMKRLA